MKTRLAALLCLVLPLAVFADEGPLVDSAAALAPDAPRYTAEQLDQLVGPIALYPDALIALILPASTLPGDVTLAARYIKNDGDLTEASGRSWDESVKSLVRYGEVVSWMDENLEWTKQLGEAFRMQPAEVMDAIQRMRAKARASGALVDTPQQQVVVESNVISLVPTQPDVIYVPYYDPAVVYGPPGYYGAPAGYYGSSPFVTFSAGFVAGAWLAFDCDWHRRTVWIADRHWVARRDHDWRHPVFPGQAGYVADPGRHQWRPTSAPSHTARYVAPVIARPTPITQIQRPPMNRDYSSNRHNVPPDRYARDDRSSPTNPPGVGGGSNPPPSNLRASRTGVPITTTPAPRPRLDPTYTEAVSGPPTPASAAPAPTPTATGSSDRRFENGRNRYSDRSDRSSSSSSPGQTSSAPDSQRLRPANTGAVSGPPAPANAAPANAAPVPASVRTYVPPAATRSAPAPTPAPASAPTYSRGGATPAPTPAAPASQPAPPPARSSSDDHSRGSRSDNEQKKQN